MVSPAKNTPSAHQTVLYCLNKYQSLRYIPWHPRMLFVRRKLSGIEGIPSVGTKEYYDFWTALIHDSNMAFYLVDGPTEEMVTLHKMLWEV